MFKQHKQTIADSLQSNLNLTKYGNWITHFI